jgi:hypothetical protein
MALHRPPGDANDFTRSGVPLEQLRRAWSARVDELMAGYDRGLFYNAATDTTPGAPAEPPGITWNAFPLALERLFSALPPTQARQAAMKFAETRRPLLVKREDTGAQVDGLFSRRQDEYCEWFADEVNGHVTRWSFTAENPEYWTYLYSQDPALVVTLYNELLGRTDVREEDLAWSWPVSVDDAFGSYAKGAYNPYNKWNTQFGAIHLTHRAHTLGAEIDLAAKATQRWPVSDLGQPDDAQRLTCCAGWGNPNRSSDPNIGKGVFDLTGTGITVTIAEPVGLYLMEPNLAGRLRGPDGTDLGTSAVRVRRGSKGHVLRLEIAVPPGATYGLNDCALDGTKLAYGGQIARELTMVVYGAGKTIPGRTPITPAQCENFCCAHPHAPDFLVPFANKPGHPVCEALPPSEFPPIPPAMAPPPVAPTHAFTLHAALGAEAMEFAATIRRQGHTRLAF